MYKPRLCKRSRENLFSFTCHDFTAPRIFCVVLIPGIKKEIDGSKKHLKKTYEKNLKIYHSREQFEIFREQVTR